MKIYLIAFKKWYEHCSIREKILVLGLAFAFQYAIFSFLFFTPIAKNKTKLHNAIKDLKNQTTNWETQIGSLNNIAESAIYKKWQKQYQSLSTLQNQYQYLLETSSSKQWQNIVKILLYPQPNVTFVQVKNFTESPYRFAGAANQETNIYQQKLLLVIYSRYFDTIAYLQRLEKLLPNIHWDNLHYKVAQYPVAKVEMEFSIFYEKND